MFPVLKSLFKLPKLIKFRFALLKSMLSTFNPNVISQYPNYQNVTQLNGHLQRVNSSRCYEKVIDHSFVFSNLKPAFFTDC